MKNYLVKAKRILTGMAGLLFLSLTLYSQADITKKQEPVADSTNTQISPSLEFITIQKSDNTIDLKASMKAKIAGNVVKLPQLKINFSETINGEEKILGTALTNDRGVALLNYQSNSLIGDKEGKINLKAAFEGNESTEAANGEVAIKKARLEIIPVKEDSVLSVKVKLVDLSTGKETSIAETDIGVFVKRLFSDFKLGEGKTDEAGEASVELPNNIPGDAKGNITLIAKLEENETYGNLEATTIQQWGAPVSYELKELPRALWSIHPPIWMMVTFTILMVAVWGHYIVIIIQLFRLREKEPEQDLETQTI